jgi:hypothetical protein
MGGWIDMCIASMDGWLEGRKDGWKDGFGRSDLYFRKENV